MLNSLICLLPMTLTLLIVARSSQPNFYLLASSNATPKNNISLSFARGHLTIPIYGPFIPIFYYSSVDDAQRRHLGPDEALSHRAMNRPTNDNIPYRTRTCPLFALLYGGRRS